MSVIQTLILSAALSPAASDEPAAEQPALPVITVVSRRAEVQWSMPFAVHAIDPAEVEPVMTHANELLDAVPATWISRGSGQEHLTAIRSPVLTGSGACGAFLLLEDGIPIRPVGHCNVNNLFELNLERADSVEVLRGPGSALHGSNALHGAMNVAMPSSDSSSTEARLLVGENDYRRLDLGYRRQGFGLDTTLQSAGSFRDDEGYDQQKLNLRLDQSIGAADLTHRLALTNLNQETAGFILGFEAYKDPALRTENLNPEAYRDAHAARASSRIRYQWCDWEQEITPFVRSSRMEFLQHFLPGKPLEENGQDSLGVQWLAHREGELTFDVGMDLEWADIALQQAQDGPTVGSAFLVATRPAGRHYDYRVDQALIAAHAAVEWSPAPDWSVRAGLRLEHLEYDYDNRLADGNLRDDGTACGFGGCLYTRPGDRDDSFTEAAPKLAVTYQLDTDAIAWMRLARGFRAPQTSELYRLQSGQSVADLEPEKLDAAELGWKGDSGARNWSLVAFYMKKRNFIFRDAEGFNVSDGQTRHRGIEASYQMDLAADWSLSLAGTFARHTYAFNRTVGRGEQILAGNRVDTAPDWLARGSLDWQPTDHRRLRAEWVHQGSYYLDAANQHRYGGHDLVNLSWRERIAEDWTVEVQLDNALNRRYAERADFAFGNYRYFPGDGRRVLLALSYRR